MNFDDLWNYVRDNRIVIYATLNSDKIERGPLYPDMPILSENHVRKTRMIMFANVKADITIFEYSNNFIAIDEGDIREIRRNDSFIFVICNECKYKLSKMQ
ncbi:hypothetical protein EDD70_0136 [Hydrogenoanaerobacterium saccharovorans]|uniref:Uncharacterized protein n=1 Tax=Hydrogenoanaerobacterium saccharovorans TaxID=474960 RepID=A0A1H8BMM9_9FIRM|nr:hypothetical protein [Hydrogenoanaerobacterium saccharovorans]RPF47361.1 hypothetical protein EDD70_0136 [Hydrogenoanaerobacterium saccharovorans]SEM83308.1 hypothetical protein SAMN05216180_1958 [Hydrogenoanaerobacterium saccharovorans]